MEVDQTKLTICSLTWNLQGVSPSKDEVDKLLRIYKEKNYDMYVIGTEESMRSIALSFLIDDKSGWEKLLLDYFDPEKYIIVCASNLNAIHLVVILKKELMNNVDDIGKSYIKTGGLDNNLGNKGAVFIWFKYLGVPLLFINCHLTAFHEKHEKRLKNYEYIINNISIDNYKKLFDLKEINPNVESNNKENLIQNQSDTNKVEYDNIASSKKIELEDKDEKQKNVDSSKSANNESKTFTNLFKMINFKSLFEWTKKRSEKFLTSDLEDMKNSVKKNVNEYLKNKDCLVGKEALEKFNFILFSGDFNSRTNADLSYVLKQINNNDVKNILMYDQFLNSIKNKEFDYYDFNESEINFYPTYRIKVGTIKEYYIDCVENTPSFTDRILYKINNKKNTELKINIDEYISNDKMTISDHKPVFLTFSLFINKYHN